MCRVRVGLIVVAKLAFPSLRCCCHCGCSLCCLCWCRRCLQHYCFCFPLHVASLHKVTVITCFAVPLSCPFWQSSLVPPVDCCSWQLFLLSFAVAAVTACCTAPLLYQGWCHSTAASCLFLLSLVCGIFLSSPLASSLLPRMLAPPCLLPLLLAAAAVTVCCTFLQWHQCWHFSFFLSRCLLWPLALHYGAAVFQCWWRFHPLLPPTVDCWFSPSSTVATVLLPLALFHCDMLSQPPLLLLAPASLGPTASCHGHCHGWWLLLIFSSSLAAGVPLARLRCDVLAQPPLLLHATTSLMLHAMVITAVDCCFFIASLVALPHHSRNKDLHRCYGSTHSNSYLEINIR